MSLLAAFLAIVQDWRGVFPQQRTFQRGVRQALGSLVCLGCRCLTRIIWTNGGQNRSWSAEYFLHSRCQWEPQQLFQPILKRALAYCPQRLVGVALDDTRLRKTGRAIPQAFYQRDPLSPPFHLNLMLGLRFLQASLLVPLHRNAPVGTRALPIRFQEVSRIKRPGKKATEEMQKQYKEAVKQKNLSRSFVDMGKQLRQELDDAGGRDKVLVLTGDGSFCNRTCFGDIPERSILLVRARKDAKLCFRAAEDSRRFYAVRSSPPNRFARTRAEPIKPPKSFMAGVWRKVRYKEIARCTCNVAPGSFRCVLLSSRRPRIARAKAKNCTTGIGESFLTTDLRSSLKQLLQIYFDRWQIEVNHREEKDTLGVGQAQLRNITSVPKQPVLAVAAYSALLLASLQAFGAERGEAYAQLPRWLVKGQAAFRLRSDHSATQRNDAAAPVTRSARLRNIRSSPGSRRCRRNNVETPATG